MVVVDPDGVDGAPSGAWLVGCLLTSFVSSPVECAFYALSGGGDRVDIAFIIFLLLKGVNSPIAASGGAFLAFTASFPH